MSRSNLENAKSQLRRIYNQKRLSMTDDERLFDAKIIAKYLQQLPAYKNNNTILFYVSKSFEVDTFALIASALTEGKTVAVPRCIPKTRSMKFYCIKTLEDLEKGAFGVYEPKREICKPLDDLRYGLCIVPGLSFDTNGYRLGYGKGYYDRFLSRFGGSTVGLCYSGCICWQLPRDLYDQNVDILITNRFVYNIPKSAFPISEKKRG